MALLFYSRHRVSTGTRDFQQGYAVGLHYICQTFLQHYHILGHGSLQIESQTVSRFPRLACLFQDKSTCNNQQMSRIALVQQKFPAPSSNSGLNKIKVVCST